MEQPPFIGNKDKPKYSPQQSSVPFYCEISMYDDENVASNNSIIWTITFLDICHYRFVFGFPPAVIRRETDRMVTNSSAADGCMPTCWKEFKDEATSKLQQRVEGILKVDEYFATGRELLRKKISKIALPSKQNFKEASKVAHENSFGRMLFQSHKTQMAITIYTYPPPNIPPAK